jgi:hypothetical protein
MLPNGSEGGVGNTTRRGVVAAALGSPLTGCLGARDATPPETRRGSETPRETASVSPDDREVETRPPGSTIQVSEFGAEPDTEKEDTAAVLDAFAAAHEDGATVVFETGEYRLEGQQHKVRGVYWPIIDLEGYDGLTVEGNGATLQCRNWASLFAFKRCTDIRVENLTIDWERDKPFTEGYVREETADYIDVTPREGFEARADIPVTNFYFWNENEQRVRHPIFSFRGPVTSVPESGVLRCPKGDGVPAAIELGGAPVEPGQALVVRHNDHGADQFVSYEGANHTFRDIDMYSIPAGGFKANHTADITIESVSQVPAEGNWYGAVGGTLFFGNADGDYVVRDYEFEAGGDDWFNARVFRYDVTAVDGRTVVAKTGYVGIDQLRYHGFSAGDTVAIATTPDILTPQTTATVQRVTMDIDENRSGTAGVGTLRFELDDELPADILAADHTHIYNQSTLPDELLVTDCTISACRGGCRIQSPNVTIADSTLDQSGVVWLYAALRGLENASFGVRPHNVTLENNTFDESTYAPWARALVTTAPSVPDSYEAPPETVRDLTIRGNTFSHPSASVAGIELRSASAVTITDNDFDGLASETPVALGENIDCESITVDGDDVCQGGAADDG